MSQQIWQQSVSLEELNQQLTPSCRFYGLCYVAKNENSLEAEFLVTENCLQPAGLLHGGVTCLLAESVGSVAANLCLASGVHGVGMSLNGNHLRSARRGDRVKMVAMPRHIGRRTHLWQIDCFADEGNQKVIAVVSLTVAVVDPV